EERSDQVMEQWSNGIFNTSALQDSNILNMTAKRIWRRAKSTCAFALYEVLIGVAVFAVGVIALGRAVENCINATTISAEENVVRQILSDRMAQVQAASAVPEAEKEFKIKTSYGRVILTQKGAPAALNEPYHTLLARIH